VALLEKSVKNNLEAQFCGGSLIAYDKVVTAAHCVTAKNDPTKVDESGTLQVLAGTRRLDDGSGKRLNVKTIAVHPKYGKVANEDDYDIAVLTLARDYRRVRLPKLPTAAAYIQPGSPVMVTGWGRTDRDQTAAKLQKARLIAMSQPSCKQVWGGDEITARMLCAESSEQPADACQGDSGGPLSGGRRFQTLYGVVSWGVDDCQTNPEVGVYVRVANPEIRLFIEDQM
jgi:secreted trypsin-like serine protease